MRRGVSLLDAKILLIPQPLPRLDRVGGSVVGALQLPKVCAVVHVHPGGF